MGGSSKSATIGYKFYAAIHMILCHGPIDSIKKILIDDNNTLIEGEYTAGDHDVNQENLFGGTSSQGGISGTLTIMDGASDQSVNATLKKYQGESDNASYVPGYRGVAGLFLHGFSSLNGFYSAVGGKAGMYLGMNPYLKTWKTLTQRIYSTTTGEEQWYKAKALIFAPVASTKPEYDFNQLSWDLVGADGADGNSAVATGDLGTTSFVVYAADAEDTDSDGSITDEIFDITLQITASTEYRNVVGGEQVGNYSWIKKDGTYGANADFNRYMIQISDPAATYYFNHGTSEDPYDDSERFAEITIQVRNGATVTCTCDAVDGYMAKGETLGYKQYMYFRATSTPYYDMNPAHIIRECLTNQFWGLALPVSEIDDASFISAADTLYKEHFGLSIKWTQESSIEDFLTEVLKHISAVLYEDPRTGLQVLKLIRDDYDEDDLIVLNESNIVEVSEFEKLAFEDLVNQVTVTYTIVETGKDGTITVQDTAKVAMQGNINSKSVDYKGFSNITNAGRAATRDLKALSSPWPSAELKVQRHIAKDFRQGGVFKWSWKDYGIDELVMRITAVDLGDGKTNTVTLTCTQDVFSFPDSPISTVQPAPSIPTDLENISNMIAFEVPYLELVQRQGEETINNLLASYPEAAFFGTAVARPKSGAASTRATLYLLSENSGNYVQDSAVQFCPNFALPISLEYLDTNISIAYAALNDFDLIDVDEDLPVFAQIDNEIVSITSIAENATDSTLANITIKRGVLDTVPAKHAASALCYVWDVFNGGSETQYSDNETVTAKFVTQSLTAVSELSAATAISETFIARAIRPYPPANVKIGGTYYPTDVAASIVLTWVDRNRLQQTGASYLGWTDSGVTLENGVTYKLMVYVIDASNVQTEFFNQNVGAVNTYTVDLSTAPATAVKFRIVLKSVRATYESYQAFDHTLNASFTAPYNITYSVVTV